MIQETMQRKESQVLDAFPEVQCQPSSGDRSPGKTSGMENVVRGVFSLRELEIVRKSVAGPQVFIAKALNMLRDVEPGQVVELSDRYGAATIERNLRRLQSNGVGIGVRVRTRYGGEGKPRRIFLALESDLPYSVR